jgi:hypothetical protein
MAIGPRGTIVAFVENTVNCPWALCIAREDAVALAAFRLVPGVEVADGDALIWLRGQQADEALAAKLASLPARKRYEWLPSNQLRLFSQRIPSIQLPKLPWKPLAVWLQVENSPAALPGLQPNPVQMRLVRSGHECDPELLITRLEDLKQFAATAAQVRLGRLEFAANAKGDVLVRGRPLPGLPGQRFVLHSGRVAVPAGFLWEPAVEVDVLTRRFSASGDTIVLWTEDGTITRLHKEQFIQVSRSALRVTEEAIFET